MSVDEYWWVLMSIDEYWWVLVSIGEYWWVLRDSGLLSSSIFRCLVCCPALVTFPLISTVWWFRPYKPYIFWKHLIQGYQNWYCQVSNTQIHKYKHTNTQIHKYTNKAHDKVPERPNMLYIFEKRIVQGYQKWHSHESNRQISKYKFTINKCQKDPTCGIFLKRGLFMDIFWVTHGCTRSSFAILI